MSVNNNNNSNINAPNFFVEHKKGEVNELMNLLKNPSIDKDPKKKKDIIKRVIAYMTLGVDVSKLFHEMVKASYINDLVTKKMVYFYIVTYAEESDAPFLVINTFLNDLKNDNAKIRGLALRNLCSLKFKGAYEYYAPSLYERLKDPHPYVRKTAVLGILKAFHLNPKLISEKDVEKLYEMIKDQDPMVVSNTLFALNEILKEDGGVSVTSKMVNHLLNFILEFNEWGQNIILELISKFKPKDENQIVGILNTLEEKDFLKHSSASIVLATCKVFIKFTKDIHLYPHVINRIKNNLITLFSSSEASGNYEMSYIILSHILLIIKDNMKDPFTQFYKKFYVFVEEPFYIKKLKLDILLQLSNKTNYLEILSEMEEYCNDVNLNFCKYAIQIIGELPNYVRESLDNVIEIFKKYLKRKVDYVICESICVLKGNLN